MMKFGSVCSGIEAASVAWEPLGWQAAFFAEIEKFPSAILAHHWPHVPNYGDFTKIQKSPETEIDLLVGGTPCQAFSSIGKRAGLDDPRGNLSLEFLRLARRLQPQWIVWENVRGVLSIDGGRTFGAFLGTLAKLGYGFAYRVLDAQYFGVPQRRRRVFVVGCLRDWRSPREALFGNEAVAFDLPERHSTQAIACFAPAKIARGYAARPSFRGDVPTMLKDGTDTHPAVCLEDGTTRYLTEREWERCFGFPDDHTRLPQATYQQRTSALGNSMAVPVMHWLGQQIARAEEQRRFFSTVLAA